MDEELLRKISHSFLRRLGFTLGATEAFAFGAGGDREPAEFKLLDHIRPGDAAEDIRQRAREAFLELTRPCVAARKPGTFGVERPGSKDRVKFCSIVPIVGREKVLGLVGFIVPCRDMGEAKGKTAVAVEWLSGAA